MCHTCMCSCVCSVWPKRRYSLVCAHSGWQIIACVAQGIEQLKSDQQTWEKKSWWLSVKAVFGHPFSYKWFSPFHSTSVGKNEVYLYTVWYIGDNRRRRHRRAISACFSDDVTALVHCLSRFDHRLSVAGLCPSIVVGYRSDLSQHFTVWNECYWMKCH